MAKEHFELSDGVKDLLSGMGKLSAEMKDNSAKAMEYAQSMDKLAKQNTELTKLNEALSTSFSKVSNALNKASNGNDLTKYIKSQEDMIKSINRTYRQYSIQSDTIKKNRLAEELYKEVNALRAVTDGVDLSSLIGNFEEVKKAISSVSSYVKSEFSVSAFKEINETIEVLEQAGLKIKNVFSTLDKGSQFYDVDRELRETRKQLDLINNADVSELTGKLKKLGEIAEDEFNTFLNLYNLSRSDYKFYDIFEEIRSGALTSQQAIERVKSEFDYLLVEAKSSGNQNYDILNSSAIREMVENITTLRIKVDEIMAKISNVHSDTTGIETLDKQFNELLSVFTNIESSLLSMKAIFVDVGDGEEFSPLLKMINNVQSSISELATSVKGIGLNMNIDIGSDSEMEAKVQSKIANALQAYQRLFEHIKMSSVGGSIINAKFFDFDINQYDTMMGKLQAYKKFIDNMRNEAKTQYGKDVLYNGTEKSYWTQASSAMGQVTKAFNEMNAASNTNPLADMFGKTDLSEVVSQLGLIVKKLEEISNTASSFKNVFKEGFNVTASVEEIDKLTNRVKELEDELAKIKLNPVGVDKSNISSAANDVFQGNKIDQVTTSAKELDNTLEQVNIPTDSFDEVLSKLDLAKSELGEIVKITKQSVSDSEGKFHDSYTLKDKRGSTEIYGLSSNTEKGQLLRSNIVGYDAKEIEKANKQILKSEQELQAQKDAFHKKNLTAIDLEIQKREEESKMVSSALKTQMEERQKQLSSMESGLKSYQDKVFNLSIKPDDAHRFPEYQAQLDSINKAIKDYETHINSLQNKGVIDPSDIDEANRLEEIIKNLLKDTKKFSSGDKGFTNIGADKVLEKINSILEQNSRMSKTAKDQIKAYYNEIYSGNPTRPLNEILDSVYKIVQQEREAGRAGKSWLEIFKDKKIYSFIGQAASMFSFYDLINLGRQSFETIRGIDTALVDLKKTTAMNSNQLEEFYYDSNDVAKQMGVTTQAIIEQASAWSRLGYNTKESSTQMAELSSQFAAISPDMDLDTATDGLVSSMKAFDIEVSNVERDIMDNINRIGNTAATSNGEIVDMLTRSSAAMAAANNTIQETIALETAAVEITRNAETTGMKCAA